MDFDYLPFDKANAESEDRLKIFDKYGYPTKRTDFSLLLYGNDNIDYWSTNTIGKNGYAYAVTNEGKAIINDTRNFYAGVRPCIQYSKIKDKCKTITDNNDGTLIVQYGEYAKGVCDESLRMELEHAFNTNKIKPSLKEYYAPLGESEISYYQDRYQQFEYEGYKYVRIPHALPNVKLNNNELTKANTPYWVKVEPCTMYVDLEKDIALSEDIQALANLEGMELYKTIFSYDMLPYEEYLKKRNIKDNNRDKNDISYTSSGYYSSLMGAINSDIPVNINCDKKDDVESLVRAIDPTYTILTGSFIDYSYPKRKISYMPEAGDYLPKWYCEIVGKCEKEPGKIHILFVDGLQDACYTDELHSLNQLRNIIVERKIGDKYPLPSNLRIVTTTYEKENKMEYFDPVSTKDIFDGFYETEFVRGLENIDQYVSNNREDIFNTHIDSGKHSHVFNPVVYSYLRYKEDIGESVISTKYNGIESNATPYKWNIASKLVSNTNYGFSIKPLFGVDIQNDFTAFEIQDVITPDRLLSSGLDEKATFTKAQKYRMMAEWSMCDYDSIDTIRRICLKNMPECIDLFDKLCKLRTDSYTKEKLKSHELDEMINGEIEGIKEGGRKL